MISRKMFVESLREEAQILKHLYSKVPQDKLDYRPSAGQRSLRELLDYMPCNFAAIGQHVIKGDFSTIKQVMDATKAAAREDFNGTVDRECEAFVKLIEAIPEKDLAEKQVTLPNGLTRPLAVALLSFNMKFLAGYRVQLFLYLKACGRTDLVSRNLWRGADPEPK